MIPAHRRVVEQARAAILVARETQAELAATRARLRSWPDPAGSVDLRRRYASFAEEARIEAEHGEALEADGRAD